MSGCVIGELQVYELAMGLQIKYGTYSLMETEHHTVKSMTTPTSPF